MRCTTTGAEESEREADLDDDDRLNSQLERDEDDAVSKSRQVEYTVEHTIHRYREKLGR